MSVNRHVSHRSFHTRVVSPAVTFREEELNGGETRRPRCWRNCTDSPSWVVTQARAEHKMRGHWIASRHKEIADAMYKKEIEHVMADWLTNVKPRREEEILRKMDSERYSSIQLKRLQVQLTALLVGGKTVARWSFC